METEVQEKIRITSTGRGSENSISLTGFSKENLEKMIASMTAGTLYVRVEEGKLFSIPAKEELPKFKIKNRTIINLFIVFINTYSHF